MLSFNREPWIIVDKKKKGETYQQNGAMTAVCWRYVEETLSM